MCASEPPEPRDFAAILHGIMKRECDGQAFALAHPRAHACYRTESRAAPSVELAPSPTAHVVGLYHRRPFGAPGRPAGVLASHDARPPRADQDVCVRRGG